VGKETLVAKENEGQMGLTITDILLDTEDKGGKK
jgi:hypothetical protein